jgi:hypothetical protein
MSEEILDIKWAHREGTSTKGPKLMLKVRETDGWGNHSIKWYPVKSFTLPAEEFDRL